MNKRRLTITALTTAAFVAVAGTAADAAAPARHHGGGHSRAPITIKADHGLSTLLQNDVVVFRFRVFTDRSHPWVNTVTDTGITGGSWVFFQCSYGNGRDATATADQHVCEDLPTSRRHPVVYTIGVRANGVVGSSVTASIQVTDNAGHVATSTGVQKITGAA